MSRKQRDRDQAAQISAQPGAAAAGEQVVAGDGSGEALPATDTSIELQPVREVGPVLVEVTLLRDHEHADKPYKAGDKLKVSLATEAWLREQGVI